MPHTFTAHPDHPAVAYPARLHADLGGQLRANKIQATKLANDMRAVEAVLQLFDRDSLAAQLQRPPQSVCLSAYRSTSA